jgi:hypothetical protein
MTSELLDVLNVVGLLVELEPDQSELLEKVLAGPLVAVEELTTHGILPSPKASRRAFRREQTLDLFE